MTTRIEGQRLDVALQRLRETDTPSAVTDLVSVTAASQKHDGDGHGDTADHSPQMRLVDFIMPTISNPAIFHDHNAVLLLEHLRDEVLPHLTDDPELTEIVTKVIDDELDRHRFVRECRMSGIAS